MGKKDWSRRIDRLVMGAIIGGAIGSVVGAKLTKKKGSTHAESGNVSAGQTDDSAKKPKKRGIFWSILRLIFTSLVNRSGQKLDKKQMREIPDESPSSHKR